MVEIVVYLTEDYTINESFWVDKNLTINEIEKIVNEKYIMWYYFDIIDHEKN